MHIGTIKSTAISYIKEFYLKRRLRLNQLRSLMVKHCITELPDESVSINHAQATHRPRTVQEGRGQCQPTHCRPSSAA